MVPFQVDNHFYVFCRKKLLKLNFFSINLGLILDDGNHPIENAKVSIKNPLAKLENYTNHLGQFALPDTPAGQVELEISANRFATNTT